MKVFQKTVSIATKRLNNFVKITDGVQAVASESEIKNGIVFANALHNTAALIIQENDPSIHKDLVDLFERIAPLKGKHHHSYEGNVNATAHLKSNLLGTFVTIPLKDRKLVLGTWQNIFLVELFESRRREVLVTVIGQ